MTVVTGNLETDNQTKYKPSYILNNDISTDTPN